MRLNDAQAFVTVVREGSFTAAGRRLGVPTSTVSRQIKRLEEHLGVVLLQRTTRRISVTEVGSAYFEECERGLELFERAEAIAGEAAATPRGLLRVATPSEFSDWWTVLRLGEFLRAHPAVQLELQEAQRQVNLIEEGFDVALRGGSLRDSSLVVRRLFETTLGFYASHAYVEEHGAPTTFDELTHHPLLQFPGVEMVPFPGPNGPSHIRQEARFVANSWKTLRQLALEGHGIVTLIRHASVGLVPIMPEHVAEGGSFNVVYPSSRLLSPKVRVFIDHVVAASAAI